MVECSRAASERSVLLVLHDVAPHSWLMYEPFVAAVDKLGTVRMTWLVVPDFHRRSPLGDDTVFQQRMDERLERGDELALHGYYHCDDSPAPRTLRDYFMRRIYTWEGEFYGLNTQQALARLEAGVEVFRRLDWPLHGFVAPAWLMSQGTREALSQLPLSYTSDPQHLFRLPDFTPIDAPGMVWSARSAWRRTASKLYSDFKEHRLRDASTIRLGLHPVDMLHRSSRDYWFELLLRLLEDGRQPMTKIQWLESSGVANSADR
ncbi:DUF2334 domain-containing protein [Pseudomonas viridiflava]|uniref:DUF2334 domain-containing protein n=1 Tax=Pseudomonas viridiflava TaxID=33069 RepID=UPI001C3183BD|nr:polysaccharide deacetylase family protein [Pseudomonas viridiflava]QXG29531.1 polysaccharide deacetylase family protein [Pseudomonas viridiflava]